MPNIKSAKKRVLVIEKKTLENRMVKSAIRTELRKFDAAVTEGNKATAQELYNICVKKLLLRNFLHFVLRSLTRLQARVYITRTLLAVRRASLQRHLLPSLNQLIS